LNDPPHYGPDHSLVRLDHGQQSRCRIGFIEVGERKVAEAALRKAPPTGGKSSKRQSLAVLLTTIGCEKFSLATFRRRSFSPLGLIPNT
jgi:hypothetical protein